MRTQVEKTTLLPALQFALGATSADADILRCVKLSAGDAFDISACRYEVEARARIDAATAIQGITCVNAADLTKVVRCCGSTISLQCSGANLQIQSDGIDAALPTLPAEVFPTLQGQAKFIEVEHGAKALLDLHGSCATEDVRWNMKGVCFAQDGAIASTSAMAAHQSKAKGVGQIVPASAAQIIGKMKEPRLFLSDHLWRAESEGRRVWGKLIDANFPLKWSENVTATREIFRASADDLLDRVKAATLGRAEWLHMRTENGAIVLSGDKFKDSHVTLNIVGPACGSDFSAVIDAKAITQALQAVSGDLIVRAEGHQFVFEGSETQAVVMALRDQRNQLPDAA